MSVSLSIPAGSDLGVLVPEIIPMVILLGEKKLSFLGSPCELDRSCVISDSRPGNEIQLFLERDSNVRGHAQGKMD